MNTIVYCSCATLTPEAYSIALVLEMLRNSKTTFASVSAMSTYNSRVARPYSFISISSFAASETAYYMRIGP